MHFHRWKFLLGMTLIIVATSCGSAPAKAPGSNPEDMTPEGHEAAAEKEQKEAAKHRERAGEVQPAKPVVENAIRQGHESEATQHQDFSQQHSGAAAAARDAGAK